MYHIQLMLTKKCNQKCSYCTTHSINDSTEVNIDYLDWVIDQLPTETAVEMTGGEIGLVENIDIVYSRLERHPSIKHITALSNGLLRKRGTSWLKNIEYWEHLIYKIKGKEIIKFYNLDLEQDHKYVIVTDETTTISLLANWDYFEELGIFRNNFFYKLMNHKSSIGISNYYNELCTLYNKLNLCSECLYFKKMLMHFQMPNYLRKEKELCQKYPPNIFIDFNTKQLGHCAMNVNQSNKVEFNKPNLERMMNGVYSENEYCKTCYSFDNGKNRGLFKNRSYIQ